MNEPWDGTPQDFERHVREQAPAVFRFFIRMGMTVEEAEDVTQETFVKIWRWLGRYDRTQKFRPWIFAIARNTAIDFFRKKQKTPILISEEEETAQELLDTRPLPDEVLAQKMSMDEVETGMRELDLVTRTTIVLHDGEGFTFQEIADESEESLNTVKSRYRRGILKLREILHRKSHEAPKIDSAS